MTNNPQLLSYQQELWLLLTWEEYKSFNDQNMQPPAQVSDEQLLEFIYAISGGHISVVNIMHTFIGGYSHPANYSKLFPEKSLPACGGTLIQFDLKIMEEVFQTSFQNICKDSKVIFEPASFKSTAFSLFLDCVRADQNISKGLPPLLSKHSEYRITCDGSGLGASGMESKNTLQRQMVAFLMKLIKEVEIPFKRSCLPEAVRQCLINGWVFMEWVKKYERGDRDDEGNVSDQEVKDACIISFPSPSHRLALGEEFFTATRFSTKDLMLREFIINILKGFSPKYLSRASKLGYKPMEYHFQMEFHRVCSHSYCGLISLHPEHVVNSTISRARVDFTVPNRNWNIELSRDGSRHKEHIKRIQPGGAYHGKQTECMLVDFRQGTPNARALQHSSGAPVLYAVLTQSWTNLDVLDSKGDAIVTNHTLTDSNVDDEFWHSLDD
ncbi:hypothetical protein VKT23_016901 [Stygiomarasmius scandens]|uniref:Uncharacterized protein n=1 Tax=Marasmiellus scandens TaxID=2682957 RepID=A0ABR1ITY6_9AGAR